jgi:hypothetical protein
VLQTALLDAATVQRLTRAARYWDLVANSGRFKRTLPALLQGGSAFAAFLAWSDWLWDSTDKTQGLTPESLVDALFDYLTSQRALPAEGVRAMLLSDYVASGARARPQRLHAVLPRPQAPVQRENARLLAQRQDRHA